MAKPKFSKKNCNAVLAYSYETCAFNGRREKNIKTNIYAINTFVKKGIKEVL
jgi:hypothetical protein